MPDATAKDQSPLPPTEVDRRVPISDTDRSEIEQLYDAFRRGKAKLVAPNGEARLLPDSLYSFLIELIGLLNEGKSVMIVQHQAKLTTVEAASILGVSRQFLSTCWKEERSPTTWSGRTAACTPKTCSNTRPEGTTIAIRLFAS